MAKVGLSDSRGHDSQWRHDTASIVEPSHSVAAEKEKP